MVLQVSSRLMGHCTQRVPCQSGGNFLVKCPGTFLLLVTCLSSSWTCPIQDLYQWFRSWFGRVFLKYNFTQNLHRRQIYKIDKNRKALVKVGSKQTLPHTCSSFQSSERYWLTQVNNTDNFYWDSLSAGYWAKNSIICYLMHSSPHLSTRKNPLLLLFYT